MPSDARGVKQVRSAIGAVGLVALCVALFDTSPAQLVNLNWDNGGYVADMAMGRSWYLIHPWSAHFAIAPLYSMAAWIMVRVFHGTVFDGLRLATCVFFVLSAVLFAELVARVTQHALATLGLGALFVTMWVHQFLLLTVEDNLLYIPCLILLFRVALVRQHAFRRRDALLVGALAGLATMLSLQALLYLFPALWLCLIATPARGESISTRLGTMGLCVVGAVGAVLGIVLVMATGRAQLGRLFQILLAPPNPPLALRSPTRWRASLESLGWAAGHLVSHTAYDPISVGGLSFSAIGALFLFALAIYCGVLLVIARKRRSILLACVACTLFAFSLATPLRLDEGYAYLKRFDFSPTCLVLSIALLIATSRARNVVAGIALVLACAQLGLGTHWAAKRRASYGTLACPPPSNHPQSTWYGRDGKSWVAYFRDIRLAHPDACVFLFDLDEISEGLWWQEVPGALWSELPNHVALGKKSAALFWKDPPRVADPRITDDPKWHQSCAVATCAAARRLASP